MSGYKKTASRQFFFCDRFRFGKNDDIGFILNSIPMSQNENVAPYIELARYLKSHGHDEQSIRTRLLEKGASSETCDLILNQFKKLSYAKRRGRGVTLVFIGGIILVVGFALTFLLFHTNSAISYVMYGLTTLGTITLLVGVVDIFGLK